MNIKYMFFILLIFLSNKLVSQNNIKHDSCATNNYNLIDYEFKHFFKNKNNTDSSSLRIVFLFTADSLGEIKTAKCLRSSGLKKHKIDNFLKHVIRKRIVFCFYKINGELDPMYFNSTNNLFTFKLVYPTNILLE